MAEHSLIPHLGDCRGRRPSFLAIAVSNSWWIADVARTNRHLGFAALKLSNVI